MEIWLMIAAANMIVGACVGMCGVAGFLLPIFYTAVLHMSVPQGLALSFAAFIVSGVLGSVNYQKAKNLDIRFGIQMSIGSLAGAVVGVKLNQIIPAGQVKILLYLVVLLSGISILLRKNTEKPHEKKNFSIKDNVPAALLLGFLTSIVCSISGAGGPILVMPLLVLFGFPVRMAVGISLFNSIFIGIPAAAGYLLQSDIMNMMPVLIIALTAHGLGVFVGSKKAVCVNQNMLKRGIAFFSIVIAVCKLLRS